MDETIVLSKLESLRRCVARIEAKTPPAQEDLAGDYDLQDIVSINLERAIQVCVDICAHMLASLEAPAPQSMAAGFDALVEEQVLLPDLAKRMKKAVGFRNISVHLYQDIDWAIVYSIITERLSDFSDFAAAVTRWQETATAEDGQSDSP